MNYVNWPQEVKDEFAVLEDKVKKGKMNYIELAEWLIAKLSS
tara:strand:- start:1166 stop:1291 length:126 start_codon:yes stop_codon:yes gene_type:complete